MKSKEDIAEIIFDAFRKRNSKAGHIIMMRVFRLSILPALNPKEQELFPTVVNELITQGFIVYEETDPECLRLTEVGYEHIYSDNATPPKEKKSEAPAGKPIMFNPLKILNAAIEKVPFVKYALGVAGIAAAIAIIKSFGIDKDGKNLVISILAMLGLMVLLFLFSSLTTSKDKVLKLAGYILVFTTVAITCAASIVLTISAFGSLSIFPQKAKGDTTTKIGTPLDTGNNKAQKEPISDSKTSLIKHITAPVQAPSSPTTDHRKGDNISSCFPIAGKVELLAPQSEHDAIYFSHYVILPVESIFWKATITKEFNDELDCIYADSHGISVKLHMQNLNDITCAKELKLNTPVLIWGVTKAEKSAFYIDVTVDKIKIIQ